MSATSPVLRAHLTATRKARTLSQWLFDNQAILSLSVIAPLLLAHMYMPAAQPYTSKFLSLSYYNERTGKYGAGPSDLCFVGFCIVVCTGIRAALMQHVLVPLGWRWGASTKKDVTRFAEQGWVLAYYSAAWPLGMYLYYKSPYFLNLEGLWVGWPQSRELDGLMKGYFSVQWAYWLQQLIVVNIEASRKDYWEMVIHHVITTSLIAGSYAYHLTRVGHLILMLMDAVELVFPLAKCLKYIGFTTVCDIIFGVFMVTWALTRHLFYLMVTWSFYRDVPRIVTVPCYKGTANDLQGPFPVPEQGWSHLLEPFHDPEGTVCLTKGIHTGFLTFLIALELVICVWSYLIVRVAARVLKGSSAEDVRSDDEEELEVKQKQSELKDVGLNEKEVGVESVDMTTRRRPNGRQPKAGLPLSRSSDRRNSRKELLNRIGCDKQIE
ncbi:Sphingosine N-acyltransferase-like protein [Apiospora aurea]|uniref:Sphingosine N-acyltransferase-like protein n=1 Tax=Apiospora aurea TaxID=335848 RepID=A0ABR1QKV7_9PEZI